MIQKYDATPTRFVESRATQFAFREFGKESDVPLIPLSHLRASTDNRDPQLLGDGAEEKKLIVLGNKGVASTNDLTRGTYGRMADGAAEFTDAPYAQLVLCPDSGHGFLFQNRERLAEHLRVFLNRSFDD